MTENADKVTITLKADGGAPWIVIHADSADEAHSLLGEVYSGSQSLAEHAAVAAASLTNTWADQKRQQQTEGRAVQAVAAAVGGTVQRSQPAPQGGFGQIPSCSHGERTLKSGSNARGEWSAWMCSAEKGDPTQHQPIDAKTGKEWPKR